MDIIKPDPSNSQISFNTKSGSGNFMQYEDIILLVDDPFLGLITETKVDLKYEDGFAESVESDESGQFAVKRKHGKFIDLKYSTDAGDVERRIFIAPDSIDTDDGVWQRLANLGYSGQKKPPASPSDPVQLQMAVEEFQAEHGLDITGEIDKTLGGVLSQLEESEPLSWAERVEAFPGSEIDETEGPKSEIT